MFETLKIFLDILRDLLPDRSQPNQIWISRILVLFFALFGAFYLFFFTLQDTEIGKRVGFNSTKAIIQIPTFIEFVRTHRNNVRSLYEFRRDSGGIVNSIFLVALYSKQANDFVTSKPEINTDLLIFAWAAPQGNIDNIQRTEVAFNTNKDLIFTKDWSSDRLCFSNPIPDDFKNALLRIYPEKPSTHYTVCKILDRTQKLTVVFTISFFQAKDLLETGIMEYRQRETTINISQRYSRFTIPYQAIVE